MCHWNHLFPIWLSKLHASIQVCGTTILSLNKYTIYLLIYQFIFIQFYPNLFYIFFHCNDARSQTYSANEVDLILAVSETGETIEWVEIDPAAFTGIVHTHSKLLNSKHTIPLQLIVFLPFREWWVGHCPSSSQEGPQHTVYTRWPGVSGDHVQSDHPKETPVLHHQHHPALLPYLLLGRIGLFPTCTRSVRPTLIPHGIDIVKYQVS